MNISNHILFHWQLGASLYNRYDICGENKISDVIDYNEYCISK